MSSNPLQQLVILAVGSALGYILGNIFPMKISERQELNKKRGLNYGGRKG
jgi:hypothetical protein